MFRAFQPSEALGTCPPGTRRAEAPGATLAREGTEASAAACHLTTGPCS
jgi:hypothetical protein